MGGAPVLTPGNIVRADTTTLATLLPRIARGEEILTPDALAFLGELHARFDARRRELLAARAARQRRFDAGAIIVTEGEPGHGHHGHEA